MPNNGRTVHDVTGTHVLHTVHFIIVPYCLYQKAISFVTFTVTIEPCCIIKT